jgi:DnaJ-domain-containing protein 1
MEKARECLVAFILGHEDAIRMANQSLALETAMTPLSKTSDMLKSMIESVSERQTMIMSLYRFELKKPKQDDGVRKIDDLVEMFKMLRDSGLLEKLSDL